MKEFNIIITDELGIHARPATLITREAEKYKSEILLILNEKVADCKKGISIMLLAVKHNNIVTVRVQGPDEDEAMTGIQNVLFKNLASPCA